MVIMLYIAAFIAVVAFVVFVIYAVITMKAAKQTLTEVLGTLNNLEKQMGDISSEATALLNKTNKLADDVNQKSTKLDGLFEGAKGIGETVRDFNQSLKKLSNSVASTASQKTDKSSQAVKWGVALMDILKNKKNK